MGLNQCVIRIAFSTSCDTQSYQSHKIWDLQDFSQSCVALSKIHCCLFSPKPAGPLFPIPPPPNQINTIFPLTTLLITSDNLVENFFEHCLSTMISLRSVWKRPPENHQYKFGNNHDSEQESGQTILCTLIIAKGVSYTMKPNTPEYDKPSITLG